LQLYDSYTRICKKRQVTAVCQSEFFSLTELVESRGIITVKKAKQLRQSQVNNEQASRIKCTGAYLPTLATHKSGELVQLTRNKGLFRNEKSLFQKKRSSLVFGRKESLL